MADPGFAFIHGAGLGGWIWEEVASAVAYPCVLADFPHRDGDPSTRQDLGLEDYVAEVERQVEGVPAERVIVVAHSIGGVVGLRLAERLGERLAGFIAVGAVIPTGGGSFLSALPPVKGVLIRVLTRVVGTRPTDSAIRNGLCNDLTDERADEVVRRFAPESRRLYVEPAGAGPPPVPRMYVRLRKDQELSLSLQTAMARNLGTEDVRELDSGHLPMIARPGELAAVLAEFGASQRSSAR